MDNEYRDIRLQKAETLRQRGINPYAVRTPKRTHAAELVKALMAAEEVAPKGEGAATVAIPGAAAGRILAWRTMGKKAIFADLWDESGKMQLYLNQGAVGPEAWETLQNVDLGDHVWVSGNVQRTRTGEVSLFVDSLRFLTKALAVPPLEKSGGLQDIELRSRKRYADLLASPERREMFRTRSVVVTEMRAFLTGRGFMEVETPMMHPIPGGAKARPFVTHHNALDMELYLRIAPELYLKRLLVGGYERVFEVNRNFRNEGVDATHNPEFTMLELYEAYGDYHSIMELTESMIAHLARRVRGAGTDASGKESALNFHWNGHDISLEPPFRRAAYGDLFLEHVGVDMLDEGGVRAAARKLEGGAEIAKLPHWTIVDELFDEHVQSKLIQPTFVIDYPTVICPLTKAREDRPELCERFELFISGMEFANAFSELNDPVEQLKRFEEQVQRAIATKDLESPKEVDRDYVEALEFGMPPAGGLGVGVDRLVMLLTGTHSIRDVILFPHMRKEA